MSELEALQERRTGLLSRVVELESERATLEVLDAKLYQNRILSISRELVELAGIQKSIDVDINQVEADREQERQAQVEALLVSIADLYRRRLEAYLDAVRLEHEVQAMFSLSAEYEERAESRLRELRSLGVKHPGFPMITSLADAEELLESVRESLVPAGG